MFTLLFKGIVVEVLMDNGGQMIRFTQMSQNNV